MIETWQGTLTALVTPFRSDEMVDEDALRRLIAFQIEGGVEGLVPCGTTGESATLTLEEQLRVVEITREVAAERALVMAGAGGNSTEKAMALAKAMQSLGVHGILSVVPYYNKPTPDGLYRHFARIADALEIPVFLYNVPGRTGVNMGPDTVLRLAAHGNIRGIKEASGDLGQAMEILERAPEDFCLFSGEDHLTLPLIALGARGVVSVVANEVPMLMSRMVREALAGRLADARELHYRLLGLMKANFVESNPIPVKAALAMMKMIGESYRLPLVPMSDAHREELRRHLVKLELVD